MAKRLAYAAIAAMAAMSLASCSDEKDDPKPDTGGGTTTQFTIPTYADDYSAISGWEYHNSWNLANVHDPSVVYWTDG